MARALDPEIAKVLKTDGFGHDAVWDCHGTWVVYHRVLEQIAAKRGIHFDLPMIVEANGEKKIAAVCVYGTLNERSEWSIGEAAPGNNKNAYPWAMAEKRAKDRVILKLIGLHGLAYSEAEAVEFKADAPKEPALSTPAETMIFAAKEAENLEQLQEWFKRTSVQTVYQDLSEAEQKRVNHEINQVKKALAA